MYRQIKKLVVLFLTGTMMTLLPQVSIAAPKGFQSPSGNIFCQLEKTQAQVMTRLHLLPIQI